MRKLIGWNILLTVGLVLAFGRLVYLADVLTEHADALTQNAKALSQAQELIDKQGEVITYNAAFVNRQDSDLRVLMNWKDASFKALVDGVKALEDEFKRIDERNKAQDESIGKIVEYEKNLADALMKFAGRK